MSTSTFEGSSEESGSSSTLDEGGGTVFVRVSSSIAWNDDRGGSLNDGELAWEAISCDGGGERKREVEREVSCLEKRVETWRRLHGPDHLLPFELEVEDMHLY